MLNGTSCIGLVHHNSVAFQKKLIGKRSETLDEKYTRH